MPYWVCSLNAILGVFSKYTIYYNDHKLVKHVYTPYFVSCSKIHVLFNAHLFRMKSYFVSWCSRSSFSVSTSLLNSLPSLPPTSPSSPTSSISSQRSSPGTSRLRNSLPSRSISPTLPWLPCDRRGRTPRPFSTLRFWNSCSRCWGRCGATRTCYIILRKV